MPMDTLAFSFTKLVVGDLEASERFYRDVFGMKPLHRVTTHQHRYALEEVILSLDGEPSAHPLILTRYLERPCPLAGAVWTGFVVSDIAATMARLEKEGGRIEVPIHDNEEHGIRAAIASDPEGHLVELIQMMASR